MSRNTVVTWLGIFLGVSLLVGCAKTPEESLVKQKGEASLKNYEEADVPEADTQTGNGTSNETGNAADTQEGSGTDNAADTQAGNGADNAADTQTGGGADVSETEEKDAAANVLQQLLKAPERYQSEVSDETGKLQVLTDADVEIPDVTRVSAISVSQHPIDQTVFDQVTDVFFPEAKIYTSDSYAEMTKDDYQKRIEELKGYVAAGNLDPYELGTDEDGNYYYDIYSDIEQCEEMYQSAPEERTLEEVRPQYGLILDDGQGGTYTSDDRFTGVACQPDGTTFQYLIKSYGSMPMELRIEKTRESASLNGDVRWQEYSIMKNNYGSALPDEEDMPGDIGITLEEAKQIADEKVNGLNLENMELTCWEYGVCCDTVLGQEGISVLDTGYMLHYTRRLNGIPITYTMEWGGNLESMDSEMETWGYEVLDIIVTEDGIDAVYFNNPYDIGDVRTENLNLLTFDKIMEIYEKMMLIQNADVLNYAAFETYYVDRITFGYSRIYEPASDSRSGLLVPVWDFFGHSEEQIEDTNYTGGYGYSSFITINAIDGSIISRGLGY